MLTGDLAFVFGDLDHVGLISTVEIDRQISTGRSARGVAIRTGTPAPCSTSCYFTQSIESLVAAGFGGSEDHDVLGVFPADTELGERDHITVLAGPREGEVFRALQVHGVRNGLEPVTATLQRVKN